MPLLKPAQRIARVCDIDLDALAESGIRGLLIDLDNTLLPRDTSLIPEDVETWVRAAAGRLRVCLVSNNWHERVHEVAAELDMPLVAKAIKPLPFAFIKAMRKVGVRARQCAVIGDQLFTDVVGGNLVGATTIMVDPLSETDLPHTLLLRRLEARIMGDKARVGDEPVRDDTCR